MASLRRISAVAALLATLTLLLPAAAGAAVHVSVRVEAPGKTVVQTIDMPFTGTLQGHRVAPGTALGALITASRSHGFPLGLAWYDCCGFFVNSIDGVAGDATHYWAFKVNQRLAPLGAGSTTVAGGDQVLFYYTTFDSATGATQPTLGLSASATSVHLGAAVTFTVRSYDDAGTASPAAGAWLSVGGIATKVAANGTEQVQFGRRGTFAVRASLPGAIRSRTVWIHVG